MNDIPPRPNEPRWPAGSLLATIPESDREALLRAGRPREFQTGQVLVLEGDRSTYVHLVVEGFVRVTCTAGGGKTALLAIRVPGELVGEQAGLENKPRSATVTAAGLTRTAYMTQSEFRSFLRTHPDASEAFTATISAKLRSATRRRTDFAGLDVPTRLARVLLDLVNDHGLATAAGTDIDVHVTQSDLAGMISASEVAVNRSLSGLSADGIVTTYRGRTRILDMERLRSRADFFT